MNMCGQLGICLCFSSRAKVNGFSAGDSNNPRFILSGSNSAASTDERPCSSVDYEFWQSQNIASVITTAIRGGTEPSSLRSKLADCMCFFRLTPYKSTEIWQFQNLKISSTAEFIGRFNFGS